MDSSGWECEKGYNYKKFFLYFYRGEDKIKRIK